MRLEWSGDEVVGSIDSGRGSAPALYYAGQRAEAPQLPNIFRRQFSSYEEYAHWIVDHNTCQLSSGPENMLCRTCTWIFVLHGLFR
jgi:hypothetical protein